MATVASAATMYVMIKAIPDANQTFREITFEVVTKKVENDIRPREFFEDFPGWVLYVRDQPEQQAGWRDVLVANTSKPDATELFLAARGRLVLKRDERRVDLDPDRRHAATPGASRGRRRRIGSANSRCRSTRIPCSSAPNCRAE